MCLKFSPADKAMLARDEQLGLGEFGCGLIGAQREQAFLGEFFEIAEIRARRQLFGLGWRISHVDLPSLRPVSAISGRKKVM